VLKINFHAVPAVHAVHAVPAVHAFDVCSCLGQIFMSRYQVLFCVIM
jgi:hypothetical protein